MSAACPPDVRQMSADVRGRILADIRVRGRALGTGPGRMSADQASSCGHVGLHGILAADPEKCPPMSAGISCIVPRKMSRNLPKP